MRRYETIIILDPDLSEKGSAPIFDRLHDLINQYGSFLIETDDWGIKKLAYEIKKKTRGHYVRFDFCSEVTMIHEMEHFFRIDDNILKFMTIVLDKKVDVEAIKNAIIQSQATETESEVEKQEESTESHNTVNEEE